MKQEPLPGWATPNHYIDRVSLATGVVLGHRIAPEELLVSYYRDYHVVETYSRPLLSLIVKLTGTDDSAWRVLRTMRNLGARTAETLARAIGSKNPAKISEMFFGVRPKKHVFRYRGHRLSPAEIQDRIQDLRQQARTQLDKATSWRILLTGGTGFVGRELLRQASQLAELEELVVLIRPRAIRDRKTGKVVKILSPAERGQELLKELGLEAPPMASRFRFVEGDIEKPDLGLQLSELESLKTTITHVIHCAANVAFDDPYDHSFRANVLGSLNALRLSAKLQEAPRSPFVAHLAIETAYMHGRQMGQQAREEEILFPNNYYNNYYELTKAMAAWETERFMLEQGLRVAQLCPSIVIGDSRSGNNHGDLKVVNAPINAFGRAREALVERRGGWFQRLQTRIVYEMARVFPGDPSAQLNLIPVDWVSQGILAALSRPEAVGASVHLATDQRISFKQMQDCIKEELKVHVRLVDPTLHRNLLLPLFVKILVFFKQGKLASALHKLATSFGGYSEWGQPVHAVGLDATVLGLPASRPDARLAFRMLCRHNKYVQQFGRLRDPLEISQREAVWGDFIELLQRSSGCPAATLSAQQFQQAVSDHLDLNLFRLKHSTPPMPASVAGEVAAKP